MNAQRNFIIFIGILLFTLQTTAQPANNPTQAPVTVTLQNNSWLPHSIIVKVKEKQEYATYGTYKLFMLPFGTKTITVNIGATVERMDTEEIQVLMSGKGNQITGHLLVEATPADNGKTIKIW